MPDITPSSIAISMSVMYPKWYKGTLRSIKHIDKIRGDLALQTITEALKRRYRVVVIERNCSKTFKQTIQSISGITIRSTRSSKFSEAKRRAIFYASKLDGVKVIVLTEPEKVSLITDCIPQITDPILGGVVDIVVPKREDGLFKQTYPDYMYQSEIEGNGLYNEMLRANGILGEKEESFDMFFGPRVLRNNKKVMNVFMKKFHISVPHFSFPAEYFDTENYSNSLYFPIILALIQHISVKSITIPFKYPKTQKENEEKGERDIFIEKRKAQRLSLLVELLHFVSFLQKNRSSGIKLLKRNKNS